MRGLSRSTHGALTSPRDVQESPMKYWVRSVRRESLMLMLPVSCWKCFAIEIRVLLIALLGSCLGEGILNRLVGMSKIPPWGLMASHIVLSRPMLTFLRECSLILGFFFWGCEPDGLLGFKQQLVWFAFKGVQDEDKLAVYSGPDQLRTILGGSPDSKTVSGSWAHKLTPATLALPP